MWKKIFLIIGLAVPFSPAIMAKDLYHTPLRDLAGFNNTDSAKVKALFAEALGENKLAAAMKKYAPNEYDTLLNAVMNGVDEKQTVIEVVAEFIPSMQALLMDYLPYSDDQTLLEFSNTMGPMMQLVEDYPNVCQAFLIGDVQVVAEFSSTVNASMQLDLRDVYIRVLETYDETRPIPTENDVLPDLLTAMVPVIDKYGADFLLSIEDPMQIQDATPCLAMGDFYANIGKLPEHDGAELLRFMLSNTE